MRRRDFIKGSALSGGILLAEGLRPQGQAGVSFGAPDDAASRSAVEPLPDLTPARWIWYPSARTLQNTFLLFRRQFELPAKPRAARGWIAADSRYLLKVNGKRIQWGPSPCDPRWLEADPMDLAGELVEGTNVLGAQVLFYGQGDGTWPAGKPGFLFWLEIGNADGSKQTLVSDEAWRVLLARAWQPGRYKRWYLRSLQEEFDARLYPYGWTSANFAPDNNWLPALMLECPANKPPVCSNYSDYLLDTQGDPRSSELRARKIPHLAEYEVPVSGLAESMWIEWRRPIEEYFEFVTPESFRAIREPAAKETVPGSWEVNLDGRRGAALTFQFAEEMVGWPYFTIEAAAGTVIEVMVQEAHQVGGPALLNTHWNSWARFICRQGANRFEEFDYEACRWVQLHIHGNPGRVVVRDVGLRRRIFPWPNKPEIRYTEPALQRLMEASINTLNNSALETVVDGVARERQQYSGDGALQLHAIHLAFGERRLPARFLSTFSQGMTMDGYFLDCWPAYDRLARISERELHMSKWGPILDHGVEFNFDCFYYYLYTGDLKSLREPYPRLLRFAQYLATKVGPDGLLPVEHLGIPYVWIDHIAYQRQRHKQCAFNLYTAAMLQHALAPLCDAMGEGERARTARRLGERIQAATTKRFWDPQRRLFVINRPWLDEEKNVRLCDRSLSNAILFDQYPGGDISAGLRALADCPPEMGFSYPANQGWRLWALGKGGRPDVVVKDFRERWATMPSVKLNNTLQEDWHVKPDSSSEWSHCPVAPLYVSYMSLAGIRPIEPGFARCEIRPQLADLDSLELAAFTIKGPLSVRCHGKLGNREVSISLPEGCAGELLVPRNETLDLAPLASPGSGELRRYKLPQSATVRLRYV
ncbi:MAG TPA: alpha-L-rhamnosidase N-terminal domain-containing protein [Terriglobia bacterium]|nr:alpha-L-rhamnosidase N-terminal domain-containing protein [Terriglobia bacterium]